ncbi:MAG: hypothetical protein C3F07_03805 [Anaerolineales bacterium]|nr:MAG: hypothetical protein C3F07_03805 [Anaerolineales bacterium]
MSHHTEHLRFKPVLDLTHALDIATNPHPAAIFEAGNGGFQVWCTPRDQPKGWEGIVMQPGAFSKPCEYVGSVHWKWEDETITGLAIETSAYALADQKPGEFCSLTDIPPDLRRRTIFNRDADIEWLKVKVAWLFRQADVPLPPFAYKQAALSGIGPYLLAHFTSDSDEYVVIVSLELDLEKFCKPGYELAHTLPIWRAGDFPTDVILRPDHEHRKAEIEPDGGPLVEQCGNATRLGEDGWLEAVYENRISGWGE